MTPGDRERMLDALGLVDWRPRADRVFGPAGQAGDDTPVAARATAGPAEQHTPALKTQAPVEHDSQASAPVDQAAGASQAARNPAQASEPMQERALPDEKAEVAPEQPISSGVPEQSDDLAQMDWDELEAWLATRDHRGATRPVFGIGARDADVLIVGEAPGANEDEQGVPFVGRAGKLLDRMLFAIGCSRETNVYITNICKFRPPNNRDPNADEVAADWPVLERQIELMAPKLVVAVGRVAAQTLLDSKQSLGKMRGTLHRYPHRELDVLVTYHPAFLLRSPGQKAKAWVDLKQIAQRIAQA